MDAQLRRGILEASVLAALIGEESYGYKIVKDLSEHIDISESTLYPILKRLEESGCVTARSAEHNGRLRKYYSISEAGRHRINDFIYEWQEITKAFEYIKEKYNNDKA